MSQESAPSAKTVNIRHRALVPICVCFAAGIVLGEVAKVPAWVWAAVFLPCVVGVWLGRTGRILFGAVLAGCFFGGAAWYGLRAMPLPDDVSHFAGGQPAEIRALVLERLFRSEGRISLKVRVESLLTLEGEKKVSGVLIVYPQQQSEARPGQEVRCIGRIQRPPGPSNWGQFSYKKYLEEHGIYSVFYADSVEVVLGPGAWSASPASSGAGRLGLLSFGGAWERTLARWVGRTQESLYERVAEALPQRNRTLLATVMCGLLFGDKSYPLPEALEEAFRRSGTIHIMVVSGTQVSLIAVFVLLLMRRSPLPIWVGSLLALGFLCLYVVTVGGTPSVLRAAVMAMVAMAASVFARQLDPYNSLAFALLVLLVLNPASLFDVGLQLSFLAVLGIMILTPAIMKAVPWMPKPISAIAAATIGSQIMVAPALTYYFHRLPLVGFVANLVVVPCVAPLLALGVGLLVCSLFWPMGAGILGTIAAPLLEWTVGVMSAFANWPWAGVEQVRLSLPGVWLLYVCLLGALGLLLTPVKRVITRERVTLTAAALAVAGGVWLVAQSSPQSLTVTALDVERGFCAVAQSPRRASVIIDGGGPASERWNAGETIILPFLLQQRIRKVDAILATDLDHDHTSGLAPVISEMPVRKLLLVGRGEESSSSQRMLHAAQEKGVEVFWGASQQRVEIADDVRLTPGANPATSGEGTQFLSLSYGNVDFIWATAADRAPLTNLPVGRDRRVVLFLPLRTRPTPELEKILASHHVAGVILTPRNRLDTMDPDFRGFIYSAAAKVFRTDVDGAVRVTTDGQSVKFRAFGGG